jgi:hypothetical protein
MSTLTRMLLTGALRKGLVALATLAVAHGWLDQGDVPTVVARLVEIAPAVVAFVWDYYEKHHDARVLTVTTQASGLTPARIAQEARTATPQ